MGQTAAIIDSYIFVWSYKGSKMDSKNVVKLFVSLFTVLNIKFKSTNFGPLQENGKIATSMYEFFYAFMLVNLSNFTHF